MNDLTEPARICVVKIGGSLLRLADCKERIGRWHSEFGYSKKSGRVIFVWIVGGGELVDVVRQWDQRFELGNVDAHLLACSAMSLTSRMLGCFFPDWIQVNTLDQIVSFSRNPMKRIPGDECVIFDCSKWVLGDKQIPQNWTVTSDSISAFLVLRLAALMPEAELELHILKGLEPETQDIESAFEVLDSHFPHLSRELSSIAKTLSIVDIGDRRVEIELDRPVRSAMSAGDVAKNERKIGKTG